MSALIIIREGKYPIRFVLIFFLLIASFNSAAAAGNPDNKFNFLLRFFDLNEAAFAYHRHCLSTEEEINAQFLKTMEFVADELFAETIRKNPDIKPEQIKTKILERRYNLQYRLDHANIKEGCASKDSELSKTHYNELSRLDKAEISRFINAQTDN